MIEQTPEKGTGAAAYLGLVQEPPGSPPSATVTLPD